ncbi:MAG TPA: MAE_28990/MAE_18760 family HEPN-like nuclease [Chitinophagales bacterium]|nr:MAE_28990/MAE_18760 family HEPN-like nuclease [Chitinophagales bacterium]
MLESTRHYFEKELKSIRQYLNHIRFINGLAEFKSSPEDRAEVLLLTSQIEEHFKDFRNSKKIFEYKALIISLYGLLEGYINLAVKDYINYLSSVAQDYNSLGPKFIEQHFDLSIKLITTITSKDYAKFSHLNKNDVLKNVNDCITTPESFSINTDAFILSAGNLKHTKIAEVFLPLSISINDGFNKSESFRAFVGRDFSHTDSDVTFFRINDLVDRRNKIAHGTDIIDDILDVSTLTPYIDFLEQYCKTIHWILCEDLVKYESENKYFKIESVLQVWGGAIVGVELENYCLSVGEFLIIKTQEDRYFKKKITSIQVDGHSYDSLQVMDKTKVAIKVDSGLKDNQIFFLLNKPITPMLFVI